MVEWCCIVHICYMDIIKIVSTNLRMLRAKHNVSQECIADKIGTQASQISRLESGKVDIKITTIAKLAHFYDVDVAYLLTDYSKKKIAYGCSY